MKGAKIMFGSLLLSLGLGDSSPIYSGLDGADIVMKLTRANESNGGSSPTIDSLMLIN